MQTKYLVICSQKAKKSPNSQALHLDVLLNDCVKYPITSRQWANMHNTPDLKLMQLNGIQPLFGYYWHLYFYYLCIMIGDVPSDAHTNACLNSDVIDKLRGKKVYEW